jgi:bifunctional ADP-heptose synthase (sugar kinase/adenylyltransferase)
VDTRNKIVDARAAAAAVRAWRERGGRVLAATGYFDVLEAAHARELAEAKRAAGNCLLLALPTAAPEAVLGARGRAEMAAALAVVDYVVTTENGPALDALLAALEPDAIAQLETADELRMRRLIEHVHRRHTGG